jgi:hypothetical protein
MTGEDVLKAADLMRRRRQPRSLRVQLEHGASCFDDAHAIFEDSEISSVTFNASKTAADAKIEALIQAIQEEARQLGVHPPPERAGGRKPSHD